LPTVLRADALIVSGDTPPGTVNGNSNGAASSVATAAPLTNRSTLLTGTRLAASTTMASDEPAVNVDPASGDATATAGGGPETTFTVLVQTPGLRQLSYAVAVNVT
jgi:hypothetical protein